VNVIFTESAINEIAKIAADVNSTVENIGARRLHTVIERLMENISFNCGRLSTAALREEMAKRQALGAAYVPSEGAMSIVEIDGPLVKEKVGDLLLKSDLSQFIL
jgi:ATP-dependent HslUV protease ATP-binding subunit HslU